MKNGGGGGGGGLGGFKGGQAHQQRSNVINHYKYSTKRLLTVLTLVCLPALMAPDCRSSSSAAIAQPSDARYCDRDIPATATVSMANSDWPGNAALLLYRQKTGTVSVLRTSSVSEGASQTLSHTIPWRTMAEVRDSYAVIVIDVTINELPIAGTTMTADDYNSRITSSSLLARATRAIKVCDPVSEQ